MTVSQIIATIIILGFLIYFLNDVIRHAIARGGSAKRVIVRIIIWLLIFGVILGVGGAHFIGWWKAWPILIQIPSTVGAFFFSSIVGVFFGFYPADRASKLNPIECLRYE